MFQVYVIGEDGILKELELAGFQYLGGPVCILLKSYSKEIERGGDYDSRFEHALEDIDRVSMLLSNENIELSTGRWWKEDRT